MNKPIKHKWIKNMCVCVLIRRKLQLEFLQNAPLSLSYIRPRMGGWCVLCSRCLLLCFLWLSCFPAFCWSLWSQDSASLQGCRHNDVSCQGLLIHLETSTEEMSMTQMVPWDAKPTISLRFVRRPEHIVADDKKMTKIIDSGTEFGSNVSSRHAFDPIRSD